MVSDLGDPGHRFGRDGDAVERLGGAVRHSQRLDLGSGHLAAPGGAVLHRRSAAALRAVTGSETTDQRNRLGSFLSASAVKTCVPSGRSLGAMVIGTSNSGAEILPHVELGVLAADEHRDLARTLRRFGLGRTAPGGRAVSFFTSGATAGVLGDCLDGLGRLFDGLGFGSLGFRIFCFLDLGASALAGSALVIAAVGASVFTSDFASEFASLASTFASSAGAAASSTFRPPSADLTSAALAAGSDFGASASASAFDVSAAGGSLAADGVASDTSQSFTAGSAALASAVRVCSRNACRVTDG